MENSNLNKTGSLAKSSSSATPTNKFRIDESSSDEEKDIKPKPATSGFIIDSSDEDSEAEKAETAVDGPSTAPAIKKPTKFMPNLNARRNKSKQVDEEILVAPQHPTAKRTREWRDDSERMVASGPFSMGPAVKGAVPSASRPSGPSITRAVKEVVEDDDMYMPIGGPVVGHKGTMLSHYFNNQSPRVERKRR
jgi:hypothetical protein